MPHGYLSALDPSQLSKSLILRGKTEGLQDCFTRIW